MCWNANVSIKTFFLGAAGIIFGSIYGGLTIPTILFYSSIVFMQLIEYIIWTYGSNKTVNYYTSIAASLLLGLQPIASILTFSKSTFIPILAYVILMFLYKSIDIYAHKDNLMEMYRMYKAPNGHLVWNWIQPDIYTAVGLTIYFIFLLGPVILTKKWDSIFIVLLTLLLSVYTYYKYNTWGSMWCWIVSIIVIIICAQIVYKYVV